MRVPLLDLTGQYQTIKDEVVPKILDICERQQFILGPEVLNLEDAWANYVIMSDATYHSGTRRGSAAWVILKFEQGLYTLVLGGAMLLNDCHDSMDAELRGLELATRAFMNFIRGSAEVIPHHVDRTLEQHELPNLKLLNI